MVLMPLLVMAIIDHHQKLKLLVGRIQTFVVVQAMVWTEQDIMAELGDSSLFLKKKKTSSDHRIPEIEETLVRRIVFKCASIKVDAAVAMKLHLVLVTLALYS